MEFLKEWLWWFLVKLQDWARSLGDGFKTAILALVPDTLQNMTAAETFGQYYNVVNTYLPLTEAIGLYGLMSTFHVGMITYRFIKSWIPTVSGS